jgi:hypothetical protein
MEFQIIEDCSPYYIRFTHPGIEDIIEYCQANLPDVESIRGFKHYKMPEESASASDLLDMTPISKYLPLEYGRVSLFISRPGLYYRAHKDGTDTRISINYTVKILDDKCVTSWYSDEDLKDYPIDNSTLYTFNSSRECLGFDKEKHTPLKSMVAKQGECILFNTDIFHDWDNRQSPNERIVLTLRVAYDQIGQVYFEDVKRILFNL